MHMNTHEHVHTGGYRASFIVLGSALQASSYNLPQFMIGRFIVGFGNPMCATTAAVFLVELSYPTWRGLAGGLYNVLGWNIGANSKSGLAFSLWLRANDANSCFVVLLRYQLHHR